MYLGLRRHSYYITSRHSRLSSIIFCSNNSSTSGGNSLPCFGPTKMFIKFSKNRQILKEFYVVLQKYVCKRVKLVCIFCSLAQKNSHLSFFFYHLFIKPE